MERELLSVWIPGDQLLRRHPVIAAAEGRVGRAGVRIVLVESDGRLRQLPYQRKKLVLLLSAMRHYANWLREAGYAVEIRQAQSFVEGLREHVAAHRPSGLLTMAASEYATRSLQQNDLAGALGIPVDVLPNTQFLIGRFDPNPAPAPGKRYVMESFYRAMRTHFGVLLDDAGQPEGERWNFDEENRKPLPKGLIPPPEPRFPPDAITRAVIADVQALDHGVGDATDVAMAVTHADAEAALADFLAHRLANFGPYEDALSREHGLLFHSNLAALLNIGLLDPLETVRAAEQAYRDGLAPLNSVEGFIRQILGWREYIGWQYWRQMPGLHTANSWQATRPLPAFFWSGETDMACLGTVVNRVLTTGYAHHIERLMVLCNFCLIAGIDPAQVNDWFLACFSDAYDWVVTPNVIGMGLNADGGQIATKPYAASANYLNKMGDFCRGCRYDPKQRLGENACPFNALYWNFLITHETTLRANPRLGPAVLGLRRIDDGERDAIRSQAAQFLDSLPTSPEYRA